MHLSFAVSICAQIEWAGSALNFEALIAKGKKSMDADKQAQIQAHIQAVAALLYEETDPEDVKTLEGIEAVVRGHILEHVSPAMGNFLSQRVAARAADADAGLRASSDN